MRAATLEEAKQQLREKLGHLAEMGGPHGDRMRPISAPDPPLLRCVRSDRLR